MTDTPCHMSRVATPDQALTLLRELGATPWLLRHHELVVDTGRTLLEALPVRLLAPVDRDVVLIGCALHDIGKIRHPAEMREPGHQHEEAGRELLLAEGVPSELARFCVTHARWHAPGATLEDHLVALADHLWKGKRSPALEEAAIRCMVAGRDEGFWDVFPLAERAFDRAAQGAERRLARSRV